MNEFGKNLDDYFEKANGCFSKKTIFQIGIRLIDILSKVHDAGYIYNDLKLANILVGNHKGSSSSLNELRLCDFGFASKFIDEATGKYYEEDETDVFRGNMIFASLNQLKFMNSSRRDDLISLCYLMVFMFNRGQVDFVAPPSITKNRNVFLYIK